MSESLCVLSQNLNEYGSVVIFVLIFGAVLAVGFYEIVRSFFKGR